jgi:prepilin-type N-terminal cleavage/methylation domain-containing protein
MIRPVKLYGNEKGFSLAELLVGISVCGILSAVVFPYTVSQNSSYKTQAATTDLQQDVRATIDLMCRDIRMAGYNPAQASFAGVPFSACSLVVQADLDGNGSISGDNEWIRYSFDTTQHILSRTTASGTQTLSENILLFTFSLKDSAGVVVDSVSRQADIRQIQVSVTGRTARPDRNYRKNSGDKTFTLQTLVVPRNLALQ